MFELTILFIVVAGSIILGLFTFFSNPKSFTNRLLLSASIVLAVWSVVIYGSVNVPPDQTLIWVRLTTFFAVPLSAVFLLISINLPDSKILIKGWQLALLFVIGVVTMLVTLSPYLFTEVIFSKDMTTYQPVTGPGMAIFAPVVNGLAILGLVVLVYRLIKAKGILKVQLGYVTLGLTLMFGLIIVTIFVPAAIFNNIQFVSFGPLYALIFLTFTSYAIVRHRLLDIRILVARTVSYSLLASVVVLLYVVALSLITRFVPESSFSVNEIVLFIILTLFTVSTSGYILKFLEKITERIFFKTSYETEEVLSKITQKMASTIERKTLSDEIISILVSYIKMSKAAFVLIKNHEVVDVESLGYEEDDVKMSKWAETLLHKSSKVLVYEEIENTDTKSLLREHDINVVMPLKVKDDEIGLFLIGPKSSGEVYSAQDIELFEILTPQLAVALQNAQSYAEIQEFSRTLEKRVEERTKELEKAQKSEIEKQKEVIKLKDEFVFIATHDLRTPVTAISGFVDLINEQEVQLPENIKEDINNIRQASSRLTELVDDLLEVARSESGTIKIESKPVEISKIVKHVFNEVKPSADKRGITVEVSLSNVQSVMADPEKLQEVIENLMSNAVKYNKENGQVKFITQEDGEYLLFTISDTGLGIPADKQDKIFTKFFRAHQKGTEEVPGTGLGLFVVRMLIEKMGGQVSFESHENVGTTFKFKLPKVR